MVCFSHEDAFLADIREHPDDDAPRLIFADWLDDHDDEARAAFIRVQVQRASLPTNHPRQGTLAACEKVLLLRHEQVWRRQLPALRSVTWADFSRGFVEAAFVETVETLQDQGDAIFAAAPIRRLQIGQIFARSASLLARCAHLARLTELNLGNNTGLGRSGARALAESPHVRNLTALLLHYNGLGNDAVADLARWPCLDGLRELYLSGNELGDEAVVALSHLPAMPHLTDLDLRDNRIGDGGARALAYYGRDRLETLWLVDNQVGPEGAWALACTEALPSLAHLYLNYNPIGDDGALAFASSPQRHVLRDLDLRNCGIRERGARALAESPYLDNLETLWLGGNRLRFETVAQLRRRFGTRLRL